MTYHEKFVDLLECNISRKNDISENGHLNVSWLSVTALQACLILADMSPQSEVFVNFTGTSCLKPDFPTILKSKKQFHYSF